MMILSARRTAGPLLAAAVLALDAGGAWAQVQVVRLPEQDRPLAGTAPQVFAIGRADGAAHEMFGEIGSVAFDASDNLYVLDRQAKRVMVYDRSGRFLRQIGREGQGPGELMVPLSTFVGGDGTVIVADLGRRAYSLFGADGTFVRNVAMNGFPEQLASLGWHPRGGVLGTFRAPPPDQIQPGDGVITENTLPLTIHSLAGGAATRVFNIPRTSTTRTSSPSQGEVMIRRTTPPAFSPPVLFGALPNGQVALSFTAGYTVRIVDLNGQTLRYLQRPMRTRLTTDRDREQARQARREMIASGRGMIRITAGGGGGGGGSGRGSAPPSGAEMERMMGEMQFADTIPALAGLRVAPSGKLWIERTAQTWGERGPVDLVTPEGEYLGTITSIRLPDAISRGGRAAFIEYDDDDVARVIVRQLPANWR